MLLNVRIIQLKKNMTKVITSASTVFVLSAVMDDDNDNVDNKNKKDIKHVTKIENEAKKHVLNEFR